MQKKFNYIFLNSAIIISIIFSIFIYFEVVPLVLSLELFGLQDATFPAYLQTKFYLEFSFFVVFEILFTVQMIILLVINIKTHRQTLKAESAKKRMKVISIIFLISTIIYGSGTYIINSLNDNNSFTCLMALLPVILYLIISVYAIFTCWLRTSNNELEDIEENTI